MAGFDLVAIALGLGLAGATWLVERKRRKALIAPKKAVKPPPTELAASGQGS
ncbi:hypothetical protein D9M68_693120 [compost metagenome]